MDYSKDIAGIDKVPGIFAPYQDWINDPRNAQSVADTKEAMNRIAKAYDEGNPEVVKHVRQFREQLIRGAYTDSEAGRALRDQSINQKHLGESDLWNMFVYGFSRHTSERAPSSSDAERKEIREWNSFDQGGRPRFPFQEVLSLIDRKAPTSSKRFEPEP